jgi:hypothetical protein
MRILTESNIKFLIDVRRKHPLKDNISIIFKCIDFTIEDLPRSLILFVELEILNINNI